MTKSDLPLIERVGGVIVLVMTGVAGLVWKDTSLTLGVLTGGVISLLNFRWMRTLFARLFQSETPSAWLVLQVILKLGLLMGAFLLAALWLRLNVIGLAVGFSSVILAVALYQLVPRRR